MAEYIEREKLIEWFKPFWMLDEPLDSETVLDDLRGFPAADVVEVVRCKDCRHMEIRVAKYRYCHIWGAINGHGDDGYCCYGERKEQ